MALKVGTDDKKKVAIAAALIVGVVIVALLQLRPYVGGGTSSTTPTPAVAQTPARPGAPTTTSAGTEHEATKISRSLANLDPTLHPEWMEAAESLEYSGKGRNIFSMESAPVDIPKPIEPARVADTGPPPPPPPPPIDLKFFGYEAQTGGMNRKAFLLHGDDVFIASVGDVVDHRYKIVGIQPLSIQVEDLPYNNTQTLLLVQN